MKRETTKSNYEPSKAKVNFAVPHENILRDFNRTLPKIIPPGKIEASLRMLAGKKDIILMGDGKLVTKGLTSNFCGDVNLFGHETSPNLVDLKDDLKSKLTFIAKCAMTYPDADVDDKYQIVDKMIKLLTSMLKEIRQFHTSENRKLDSLQLRDCNATAKYPDKAISKCRTNMYTAVLWIKKCVGILCKIGKIMSKLQGNEHLYGRGTVAELGDLENLRMLHSVEYVSANVWPLDSPHLIHKNSDIWLDLTKECYMTDDSVYTAIGLNGVKSLQKHFKQYVTQDLELEDDITNNVQKCDKNAIVTICTYFMPALMPLCAVFYEEGCRFLNGRTKRKLLSASPLGYIR